jgi:serine/threonine protein kinase
MLESGIILQNRYEIIEPIGKGGMGAVYLALDQRLGNTIALKETFFKDALMVAAFEREARLLAGLRHPALPKVIDHFADDYGQFLVMEFIPGKDLHALLQSSAQAFQPEEVLQWADQLLDALDYLHSQKPSIIHRDIKPHNLKLTARNQVVLLDFGLAKSTLDNSSTTTSGKSLFAYTPIYAPLEQIQGAGTDIRSDLYSLGATLFHLLTGGKPVDSLSRATEFLSGKPDPLPFASEINPRIPEAISKAIARAMALNRELRPPTAIAMRKMLRDVAYTVTENLPEQGKTVMSSMNTFHVGRVDTASLTPVPEASLPPLTQGIPTVNESTKHLPQVSDDLSPRTLNSASSKPARMDIMTIEKEKKAETSNRKKILLVDDDPAVTDYLQLKLSKTYNVLTTNKPTTVLTLAGQEKPDLILCDIDMPDMDGGDVARALSTTEQTRRIPILYLTSIISKEESYALKGQIGGRPGMSKHSPIDEILARIRAILAG